MTTASPFRHEKTAPGLRLERFVVGDEDDQSSSEISRTAPLSAEVTSLA
jgi:hypothetical protein